MNCKHLVSLYAKLGYCTSYLSQFLAIEERELNAFLRGQPMPESLVDRLMQHLAVN